MCRIEYVSTTKLHHLPNVRHLSLRVEDPYLVACGEVEINATVLSIKS